MFVQVKHLFAPQSKYFKYLLDMQIIARKIECNYIL